MKKDTLTVFKNASNFGVVSSRNQLKTIKKGIEELECADGGERGHLRKEPKQKKNFEGHPSWGKNGKTYCAKELIRLVARTRRAACSV